MGLGSIKCKVAVPFVVPDLSILVMDVNFGFLIVQVEFIIQNQDSVVNKLKLLSISSVPVNIALITSKPSHKGLFSRVS
jgi:hypothetical protein